MLPLVALLDDVSSAVSLATEIAPGLGPNRTFGRAGSTSIGDVSLRVPTRYPRSRSPLDIRP